MPTCIPCGASIGVGALEFPARHALQIENQHQQSAAPGDGGPTNLGPPPQYGQQNPYGPPGGAPYAPPPACKEHTTALLLCFFLGVFGVHRFYVGKVGTGVIMLLTGGGFGIWTIIDFCILCFGNFTDAFGYPLAGKSSTLCVILFIIFFLPLVGLILFLIFGILMASGSM